MFANISPELYTVIITSILIFAARIVDVTIGTIRIIFVTKGRRFLAPILGFLEILIWLLAISRVMQTMASPYYFLAYAAGFAAGNFVGIYLEGRLALGTLIVRIITEKDTTSLIEHLKSKNFGVTTIDATGGRGEVTMIYTIIKRKDLKKIVGTIEVYNPDAFYTVEEAHFASEGIFPLEHQKKRGRYFNFLWMTRKAK